jgi:hypothetical protein
MPAERSFGRPPATEGQIKHFSVFRAQRKGKTSLFCSSVGDGRPSERYSGRPWLAERLWKLNLVIIF